MNQPTLEVSVDQLFAIIGAKEVELSIARCASAATGVVVEWVKTPLENVHEICRGQAIAVLVYGRLYGCTVRTANGCRIYAPDFDDSDGTRMAVLGHELKHCFDKEWHKNWTGYK